MSKARGRGVAQPGSAPVLGTGGREFESRRPDHGKLLRPSEHALYLCAWSRRRQVSEFCTPEISLTELRMRSKLGRLSVSI